MSQLSESKVGLQGFLEVSIITEAHNNFFWEIGSGIAPQAIFWKRNVFVLLFPIGNMLFSLWNPIFSPAARQKLFWGWQWFHSLLPLIFSESYTWNFSVTRDQFRKLCPWQKLYTRDNFGKIYQWHTLWPVTNFKTQILRVTKISLGNKHGRKIYDPTAAAH